MLLQKIFFKKYLSVGKNISQKSRQIEETVFEETEICRRDVVRQNDDDNRWGTILKCK